MLSLTLLRAPYSKLCSPPSRLPIFLGSYATPFINDPRNFSLNLANEEPAPGETLKKYSIDLTDLAGKGNSTLP